MLPVALLLTLVGVAYVTEGIRRVFLALGLELDEILLFFGLAELVEPPGRPSIEARDGRRTRALRARGS